jgi:hypothetical protein
MVRWKKASTTIASIALHLACTTLLKISPYGGSAMKAFIAAVICAAAIGVGASYVLHVQQETVDVAFATSGARVGDPGHNLVGVN